MKANFSIISDDVKRLPFYVTGIGMKDNQNPICRKEGYPDFQIALCLKGQGIFSADGKNHVISEGLGFFFFPDIPHEYFPKTESWTIKWLVFNGNQLFPLLSLLNINSYEVFNIQDIQKFNGLFDKIDFLLDHDEVMGAAECSALLYTTIVEMGKCIHLINSETVLTKRRRLEPVLSYMDERYNTDLSLNEMADVINITPHFLCRLFQQYYHTTPFKYLLKLRIQKSKQLFFKCPDMLVKDVAHNVGFHDVSYFCLVFKTNEGITPTEFRSIHGIPKNYP